LSSCGEEEITFGLGAELMDEDPKATRRVPKPAGRLCGGKPVDEEGPEGFILPVGGLRGFQEPTCQC